MHIPPFQLDHWLHTHEFASPPARYNLATSTGPRWTVQQLLTLGGDDAASILSELGISYTPPDGGAILRQLLATFYQVDPDWIVLTTGASEGLSALVCLAAEPDANVVLPSLVFPAIPALACLWGLQVKSYPIIPEQRFAHDVDQILSVVDARTRLVLVTTPHNPAGVVMPHHDVSRLASALAELQIPLIVDEVYHPIYFDVPSPTAAHIPNAKVIGDLSKAFSLSGLRIGWIIEPNPTRRQQLIDARSYFTISGSPITEALAAVALEHASAILARTQAVASRNLATLEAFMRDQEDHLAWVRPDGGTTAFPWLIDGRDTRSLCERLAQHGVLTVPGDCFGAPHHFRIGFGAETDGIAEALHIASDVITAWCGG